MSTSYTDQALGGNFDPGNTGATGGLPQALTVISISLNDNDDDGLISPNGGDQVNGSNVSAVWVGDTVTIDGVTITGVTFYTADGNRYFTPSDGSVLNSGTATATTFVNSSTQFPVSNLGPPCFVAGTLIATPDGQRPVETLRPGDQVLTRNHGAQELRWTGQGRVTGRGAFAPVCIAADTLGNDRDLYVSPQHRMLLNDWRVQLLIGEEEAFVPAINLCDDDTIRRAPCDHVTYVHVMFDEHEVIFAEGAPSESFAVGDLRCGPGSVAHRELSAIFPELDTDPPSSFAAHRVAKGFEARLILHTCLTASPVPTTQ